MGSNTTEPKAKTKNSEGPLEYLTEMGLFQKAAPVAKGLGGRLPTHIEIEQVTKEFGTEFATAVLWQAVLEASPHAEFARNVRAFNHHKNHSKNEQEKASLKTLARHFEISILASNSYASGRKWGDHAREWQLWARELGFKTDIIETRPDFSVSANARLISRHLANEPRSNRILLSYGQGSSEVRMLFDRRLVDRKAQTSAELSQVRGWINVCGSFGGSRLNELICKSWFRRKATEFGLRLRGRHPHTLVETSSGFGFWQRPINVPSQTLVTSLVGVPYLTQIPGPLRSRYIELAKYGPNDGVVMALDALAHPGLMIPVQGLSHQAESYILRPILERLMLTTAVTMASSLAVQDVGEDQRRNDRGVGLDDVTGSLDT